MTPSNRLVVLGLVGLMLAACSDGRSNRRPTPPRVRADGGPARSDAALSDAAPSDAAPSDAAAGMGEAGVFDRDGGDGAGSSDARTSGDGGITDAGRLDSGENPDSGTSVVDAAMDSGVARDAGTSAPILSIYDLQDADRPGYPGRDVRVQVRNVSVTAVVVGGDTDGSFWVQESLGGPFSGVFVFRPPGVPNNRPSVGDRVTVTGVVTEFFDLTEIELESIDARTPGVPPVPRLVDPFELSDSTGLAEIWEGVLVSSAVLQVVDANPDLPGDFGEFMVTGSLRVDDQLLTILPDPILGDTFSRISGIHTYSFGNYKLLPREAADVLRP